MLLHASRLLLGVGVAVGLAFSAIAQQSAAPAPLPHGLLCDDFIKTRGDWVAKRDVMVPGPGAMMQIKGGQQLDTELQQQLDERCK